MTQLSTRRGRAAEPPPTNAANPVELLQYAVNNGVQPAQLKELMDLANAWQDREAARVYGERFAAFQADCPQIEKAREVKNKDGGLMYRFASKDDIDKIVRPLLAAHGLSVSGTINVEGQAPAGVVKVRWTIQCGSHKEHRDFTLPIMTIAGIVGGGTNAVQNLGAWMSYVGRYTYCEALHLIVTNEDTDGQAMRDVLLLDADQRKQIADWIETGIVKPDGTIHKLTEAGLLKWLQGDLPEDQRSLDRLTQDQFNRIVSTFKAKVTKGGQS